MKITLPILTVLLLASGAACADDAANILQCRTLRDSASRLACYDAMPVGAPAAAAAAPATATAGAGPAAAPQPAAVAASATAAAPAAAPEERFGLRPEVRKQQNAEPDSIRTTVAGRFDGWQPGMLITLGNGQVWRVTDDTDAVLPVMENPPVRIVRGVMGAFFLEPDGVVNRARVARVK